MTPASQKDVFADFFRSIGELMLSIPALPRPDPEWIKKNYLIKKVESDNSITNATMLELGTILRPDEPSIDGVEF